MDVVCRQLPRPQVQQHERQPVRSTKPTEPPPSGQEAVNTVRAVPGVETRTVSVNGFTADFPPDSLPDNTLVTAGSMSDADTNALILKDIPIGTQVVGIYTYSLTFDPINAPEAVQSLTLEIAPLLPLANQRRSVFSSK